MKDCLRTREGQRTEEEKQEGVNEKKDKEKGLRKAQSK